MFDHLVSDRPTSGSIAEEKPSTPNKKRGAREEKSDPKKAAKPGQKAPSPAFVESKPYWVLRVCADAGKHFKVQTFPFLTLLLDSLFRLQVISGNVYLVNTLMIKIIIR